MLPPLTQYPDAELGRGIACRVLKCVLIVDDHPKVRKGLRSIFDANGFTVCGEAVDGRDAIEKARELHPDLIVLDLSMPVMNGLEAARELKKIMPTCPW